MGVSLNSDDIVRCQYLPTTCRSSFCNNTCRSSFVSSNISTKSTIIHSTFAMNNSPTKSSLFSQGLFVHPQPHSSFCRSILPKHTLSGIIITPPLGLGGGMGTLCRGGLGGGWNLPSQTLPIPSENAGGATCRRRAASCTDISTFGAHSNLAHSNLAHSNLAGVGWGGGAKYLQAWPVPGMRKKIPAILPQPRFPISAQATIS